jgi:hypothetical protein
MVTFSDTKKAARPQMVEHKSRAAWGGVARLFHEQLESAELPELILNLLKPLDRILSRYAPINTGQCEVRSERQFSVAHIHRLRLQSNPGLIRGLPIRAARYPRHCFPAKPFWEATGTCLRASAADRCIGSAGPPDL